MKILLKACFASIGLDGNIRARDLKNDDCPYLAEVLDGIEIDGVAFHASWRDGELEIVMEGEELSQEIKPNYLEKIFLPVHQIVFKQQEARFTANALNKFIRRVNKALGQEPCNRGKMLPVNMVLIKDAESVD